MIIDHLPEQIFSSQQVRDIDFSAINHHGINGFELMTKAAQFSFDTLRNNYKHIYSIITLCGSGNNGGDGYIVAGLAKKAGLNSSIYFLSSPENLKGDAQLAYQFAKDSGVEINHYEKCTDFESRPDQAGCNSTLIIDALLGTGLNSEVTGLYREVIINANSSNLPILAIDIPSGLCANTGSPLGIAIEADLTTTFIGLKLGLLTGQGRTYCGNIFFDHLDVPNSIISEQKPVAKLLKIKHELDHLPSRSKHSHKGSYGHTLIIGGDEGYGGAALLASNAALHAGSGLTSLITHESHISACLASQPEVMVSSYLNLQKSIQLIDQATTIVIGPGLGKSAWSERMLQEVLTLEKPVILDADALNILSEKDNWFKQIASFGEQRIITPHPGEASRLLKSSTQEVQNDRLTAIRMLAKKLKCNALLKGSGSLTSTSSLDIGLCAYGNPGMAAGGMGDVLAGLLGALVSQGLNPDKALSLGVALHSYAADIVSLKNGEIGITASELPIVIRQLLNQK